MSSRVLLVDDEPNVTVSLMRALRKEPDDLLSAQSAEEALDLMTQDPVDVIGVY